MSFLDSRSKRALDFRLEYIPDHCGHLAIEPLEEHLTRQPLRPKVWVAHPAVKLLLKDPLSSVVDQEIEILQESNGLDKVDTRICS